MSENDVNRRNSVSLFDAVRRPARFFKDLALTVSSKERQQFMLTKYRDRISRLKELFGWGGTEKRKLLDETKDYGGLGPITGGDFLPLHYFDILWFGKIEAGSYAVISTSLGYQTINKWAKNLAPVGMVSKCLYAWKDNYGPHYIRAATLIDGLRSKGLEGKCLEAVVEQFGHLPDLLVVGPRSVSCPEIPVVDFDWDQEGKALIALSLAAYGSCALTWLNGSSNVETKPEEIAGLSSPVPECVHSIGLSLLCSQVDPGIKWTSLSCDGSLCQLRMENGFHPVLSRPAIPVNANPGRDLWNLIGTLSPSEGDPVWVMGSSRARGVGYGFLSPEFPIHLFFALFQGGTSPMVRRIVGVKNRHSLLSNAVILTELANGCRSVSKAAPKDQTVELTGELFAGIEQLLKCEPAEAPYLNIEKETFGQLGLSVEDKKSSSAEEMLKKRNLRVQSLMEILPDVQEGRVPDEEVRRRFRRDFLREEDGAVNHTVEVPLITRVIFGVLDTIMRWETTPTGNIERKEVESDPWHRDSQIIKLQKQAHEYGRSRAASLVERKPRSPLRAILSEVLFIKTQNRKNGEAPTSPLKYLPKLILILFEFVMVAVKRKHGALVLEERLSEIASLACDLTVVSDVQPLFRHPSDDLDMHPDWIQRNESVTGDFVSIRLRPLFDKMRNNKRLQKQVSTIGDICDYLGANGEGGGNLEGLRKACRIRWDDDRHILLRIAPAAIVHALRLCRDGTDSDQIEWWLAQLGLSRIPRNADVRSLLTKLMQANPEQVVIQMLNAAAVQLATTPKQAGHSLKNIIVRISRDAVEKIHREASPHKHKIFYKKKNIITESETDDENIGEKRHGKAQGAPPSEKPEIVKIQEYLTDLIRHLTANTIRKLRKGSESKNLEELKECFQMRMTQLDPHDFTDIISEAVRPMTSKDRQAVHQLLDQLVPEWRAGPGP